MKTRDVILVLIIFTGEICLISMESENVARGGQVAQSSSTPLGPPERAIDGNRASVWSQKSCTHTQSDSKPWWRVDLQKTYKVNTVKITNRKDCCEKRINGAEIRIGNSLNDNGNGNPRCAVIDSIPAGETKSFTCNGMEGQFVSIVIPGRKEYLTLCEVEVFGTEKEEDGENVARGGQVAQSSLTSAGPPERAIDGNRASAWSQKSCTHTHSDYKPWWRVDLQKTYKVNTVKITNRKDCCEERINGAEIRIGNSLNDNGNGNPRCAVIDSIPAGETKSFTCNGMEGQFVSIVIPGRKEYLTLCEVEVFGTEKEEDGENVARGGQVAQSSLTSAGPPERAIDGNRASAWSQKSCTHTHSDYKPWWRVDLQKTYKVNTVKITNRKDCCEKRINGAEIRIGNSLNNNGNGNPRCAVIDSIPAGETKSFTCNGMEGQFVSIVIPGRKEYLTLCEVEVFGTEKEEDGENVARGGQVAQSSLTSLGPPEKAIDGNRASAWSQKSCTHTHSDYKPWWRVDLQMTYKVNTVKITNRKDCCEKRINGAEIRIGNSLNDNGNGNPRCAVIDSIPAGETKSFTCNGMEGQFVSIVIPGRKEYLTLCEVEVFGTEKEEDGENVARGGQVAQSSLTSLGPPEKAIDGNRASAWSQKSCTHTHSDYKPWWRVDLQKTYKVNTVKITNRKDCCEKRINGAEIRIGNSLNNNGNGNPRCAVIDSIPAGETKSFTCNGMEGQFVSIVIPGRKEYLTLCEVEVFGTEKEEDGENVARGGQVAQSSLTSLGPPEKAIDGNRASAWSQKSCTHTHSDYKPWWRVDLQMTYKVNTVKITNRKDCCEKRINGAEIRIGNSLNDNGNGNPRCAVIDSIPAGETKSFTCNGMEGQFVSIVIPGRKEYLTLCEVEVFGTEKEEDGENVARGGQVAQSSLTSLGPPEKAIDGNRASAWSQKSCTHTHSDYKPWWRVDLQKTYKVNTVKITNRKDCCEKRINGAEIRIGNSLNDNGNGNPRCAVIDSIPAGETKSFTCNGMEGQFVSIVIPGRKEYLTLCEVEVFGTEKEEDGENVARGGQVAQSSIWSGTPERAIDGNRASVWSQKSCTHTKSDSKPWWRVDLQMTYKVNTVKITNRKDCCEERINGAEIRIGNCLKDNGNGNPRCAVIDSIPAGETKSFTCNGMEGQFVSIVIPGRKEYLTLCEVEVFGTKKEEDD